MRKMIKTTGKLTYTHENGRLTLCLSGEIDHHSALVLREEAESGGANHNDMVREANRIIESRLPAGASRIKRQAKLRRAVLKAGIFLGGGIAGASIAMLFSLLS